MSEEKKKKNSSKSSVKQPNDTPLMKQYNAIKAKYPGALLLFRVGDFYETFGEDAITTSRILGIVLTKRSNGAAAKMELAGFPHHSLDVYLPKLVRAGQKVAICDQLEDPKMTKKIVKRGVTELVTPGVSFNDKTFEQKKNNFLAGICFSGAEVGVSFLDVSTGEFYVAEGKLEYVDKLMQSFAPSEVVVQRNKLHLFQEVFGNKFFTTTFEEWIFTHDFGYELLTRHFNTSSLKGFGVEEMHSAISASGSLIHYLHETHHEKLGHLCKMSRVDEDNFVWLDKFTTRNLELLYPSSEGGTALIDVLDATSSPMGARMLRRWITLPHKSRKVIEDRYSVVDGFITNSLMKSEVIDQLKQVGDIERLISKVAVAKVLPRELKHIHRALFAIEQIAQQCASSEVEAIKRLSDQINPCLAMRKRLGDTLVEEPAVNINKGTVVANGVSAELDEYRALLGSGKQYLVEIQQRESEATGISSLKIGYNNVFGYYLEVTHVHKEKVPENWARKQTLTNAERYITPELKEYEQKILSAEEKILALETKLYNDLVMSLMEYVPPIQLNATTLARIDVLLSFAQIAEEYNYVMPELNDEYSIDIIGGRHPVIEQQLGAGEAYIANDVFLDTVKQQVMMITGPNMSGKSALLRQTALISIMAQIGCYVPATRAKLGIVDKIFSRVGASDNISSGESTFMVEMNETASILNNLSNRSLVLLDEIGRGTSTYDGVSIAWSIAEYLHENVSSRAKVLFATHYHELNKMTTHFARIKNYHVTIKEIGNKVIFLRKLAKGGTAHSFGIHVAAMAGMPQQVLARAKEKLDELEKTRESNKSEDVTKGKEEDYQLSFFQLDDPLLHKIKDDIVRIDINTLTPVEALMKLNEIKNILRNY